MRAFVLLLLFCALIPSLAWGIEPDQLAGAQKTGPPWGIELPHLQERLQQIGLPALRREGTALHTHQHLQLFIDGKSVPVPAAIGINPVVGFISRIHTHDNTGTIHIESADMVGRYTLGQFFDIWGVPLTVKCIGTLCNTGDRMIRAYVNGTLVPGDPRAIELKEHEEIVLTYGTAKELPSPIPSTYRGEQ